MASNSEIVPQKFPDGRYVSDIIDNRYQIFASKFYEGQYCIWDFEVNDCIRDTNYFRLFESVDQCKEYIRGGKVKKNKPTISNSEKKPVRKMRGETALSYLKSILESNSELSDNTIAEMVKSKFPDSNYNHSMVKYNRKKMYGSA